MREAPCVRRLEAALVFAHAAVAKRRRAAALQGAFSAAKVEAAVRSLATGL